MRHERLRRGAADERVHRRRLDLEEAVLVEDLASGADDVAARPEHVRHGRVGDEVDVALAVAQLHVGQAVPLLGQRAVRLGQQAQAPRLDRQLAALARGERPLGLDDVARRRVGEGARTSSPSAPRWTRSWISPVRSRSRRNDRPARRPQRHDPPAHVQARVARGPSTRGLLVACRPRPRAALREGPRLGDVERAARPRVGPTSFANGFSPRARTARSPCAPRAPR